MATLKRTTIKDIASKTNLGIGTISRFYNGGSVSQATREIISKAIYDAKYVRNYSAASIKRKSNEVIFVTTIFNNENYHEVMDGIYFLLKDMITVMPCSNESEKIVQRIINALERSPKTILLFVPSRFDPNIQKLLEDHHDKAEFIVYGYPYKHAKYLFLDNFEIFKQLGRSLPYNEKLYLLTNETEASEVDLIKQKGLVSAQGAKVSLLPMTDVEKIKDNSIVICQSNQMFKDVFALREAGKVKCRLVNVCGVDETTIFSHQYKAVAIDFFNIGILVGSMVIGDLQKKSVHYIECFIN